MKKTLRLRQRWMSLPWGVYGLIIAVIMAGVGIYCEMKFPEERPSVRLAVPMYTLALYWVFALLCNQRTARVDSGGVRVFVWPLLIRPSQRVKRDEIQHCYIRPVAIYDDGTLLESYYAIGVQTISGEQVEMSIQNTAKDAELVANQIGEVLNQEPGHRPVGVQEVEQIPEKIIWILVLAGCWLALFIGSVFVGAAWEVSRQ